MLKAEFADRIERGVHFRSGNSAVVDVDGLGVATGGMEAEGKIEWLIMVFGFDVHFIGREIAQVGERKIHLIAITVKFRGREAVTAFNVFESAEVA